MIFSLFDGKHDICQLLGGQTPSLKWDVYFTNSTRKFNLFWQHFNGLFTSVMVKGKQIMTKNFQYAFPKCWIFHTDKIYQNIWEKYGSYTFQENLINNWINLKVYYKVLHVCGLCVWFLGWHFDKEVWWRLVWTKVRGLLRWNTKPNFYSHI